MSLERLRRAIERLNRQPLPATASAGRVRPAAVEAPSVSLAHLVQGTVVEGLGGRFYRITRRVSQCWHGDPGLGRRFCQAVSLAGARPGGLDPDLAGPLGAGPEALLFLDLETCGFAGTPVFLVGTMRVEGGDLVVEQLLARSYEEEPAIVREFARLHGLRPALVSFNGKSFDWPFLRDRAAVSGVPLPDPELHCDLLHVCRRRYRDRLPDCRLQTLERHVCRRRRVGDLPGSEIPGVYHEFVRTGDARLLREAVHHNFLDLVTLADLLSDAIGPTARRPPPGA